MGDAGEYAEGGNATLTVQHDNGAETINTISFTVYGQNPDLNPITAVLNQLGPPWWFGHTLTHESSNQQFLGGWDSTNSYFGSPKWGRPDGFGLSQIDGSCCSTSPNDPLTDNVLWTWTSNLQAGVSNASVSQSAGATYWQNQLALMDQYAMQHNASPSSFYPASVNYGYCSFTPTGTGRNSYVNGYGIIGYNSGPAVGSTGDNHSFASFDSSSGNWFYYDDPVNGHGWTYLAAVCIQPSNTIPD